MANSGATSNIRISLADLQDPKQHRLNRKLDLMETQTSEAAAVATKALATAQAITVNPAPTPPAPTAEPGDVASITVTGVIDQQSGAVTLTITVAPPVDLTAFDGCHLYLEMPDQSADAANTVGVVPVGSTSAGGTWDPIDLGKQPYAALTQPWIINFFAPKGIDASLTTPCRLYGASYNASIDKKLVRHGTANETPNQTFTLQPQAPSDPGSATNVTTLTGGDGKVLSITASVLAPVNVTGKLETPILVMVTDAPPNTPGWVAQLVLVVGNADPTKAQNQQIIPGYITQAGPVYTTAADGISAPHSFALDTPTAFVTASLFLQAGLLYSDGNYQWNNIVPGITPGCLISYGSTTGTTDASSVILATISARMAVTAGLLDLAALGVTNPFLGPGAVYTINVQNLAITNPLLADLVVDANKLANSAVTSTKIANLAVGTAAIQTAAITNALIANLAVGAANIIDATITGAKIANATIADANIGTCNVSKLVAGTANFSGDVVLSRGGGISMTLASTGITLATTGHSAIITASSASFGNGSYAITFTATQMQLTTGNATATFTASGLDLANGSYHLTMSASQIQMTNTTYSLTLSSSKIELTNGSNTLKLESNLITLYGGATSQITLNNTGTATFTGSGGSSSTINGNTISTGTMGATEVDVTSILSFGALMSTTTANAGAYAAPPATVAGYVNVVVAGTSFKVALFLP